MNPNFGVYVHVPFCEARCDYCAFATWTDRAHLVVPYVEACVTDVERRFAADAHPPATSVFFGGGTPSLVDADVLMRVLDAIPRTEGAEVTVECNPDSIDPAKLAAYRRHGVTRVSLGVQSMEAHVLASLGRTHDPDNVRRAVDAVRAAGFTSFNLDLIYGAAGESMDDWRRTLDAALALDPPHISAYALTIEAGTPLDQRIRAGETPPPLDDDQAAKYLVADAAFSRAGLGWYEVSNWARPGHECRHNLLYWRGGSYLGVGASAHGHTAGRRWWNVRTPERYVAAVREGASPEAGRELLDGAAKAEESLMLGVRTRDGVEPPHQASAARLVDEGLLERRGAQVVLTRRGRLLASSVTLRLLTP